MFFFCVRAERSIFYESDLKRELLNKRKRAVLLSSFCVCLHETKQPKTDHSFCKYFIFYLCYHAICQLIHLKGRPSKRPSALVSHTLLPKVLKA
jgi:hypothetical protein